MAHLFNHERHLPVPAQRRLYARIATILQSNFRNRRPDAVSRAACSGPDEGIVAAQHTLYIVVCENRRPLPGATFARTAALRAGMIGDCGRRAGPAHGVLRIVGTEAVTDEIPQWLIRDRTQRG
jgi:hypothetical protein